MELEDLKRFVRELARERFGDDMPAAYSDRATLR